MKNKTNTLHADSPRPLDAEATRRAVIALAPAYSVALADGRPAAVELETLAADGLTPEFLEACAEEGNPVNTLADHLRDIEQRAGNALAIAKDWAKAKREGKPLHGFTVPADAVAEARNVWQAITQAIAALMASPTPPPAPKPAAPGAEAEAATHARRDFQAAAAVLRADVAANRGTPAFAPAADALAVYAAALGTRNAASAYAAALDACARRIDLSPAGFPGLTSPAWLAFAADAAAVLRAKWEADNAALHAHVAALSAAAEGERAAPAPDLDAQVAAVFAETRAAAELSDARSAAHAARHAYGFTVKDRGLSHPETRAACAAVERAADAVKRAEARCAELREAAAEFAAAEAAPAAPTKDAALAAAVGRAFASLSADVDAVNARTFAAHVANPFAPGSLAAAVIADAALSGKIERAAADFESAEAKAAEARGPGFTPRQSASARRVRDNRAAALANAWNAAAEAAERAAAAVIAENAGDVGALAALDQAAWENEAAAARAGLFSGPVAEARTRGRCALARRIALAFRVALTFAREVNAAVISENTWDAARDYLASRRANSGVFPAVSRFGAALESAGLRTNGNADAEARAVLRVRFNRCAAIYDAAHARGGCPDWIEQTRRDRDTAGAAWHAYAAPGAL